MGNKVVGYNKETTVLLNIRKGKELFTIIYFNSFRKSYVYLLDFEVIIIYN